MVSWGFLPLPTYFNEDEDVHITDVVKHVQDTFASNGEDNSNVRVEVATCFSSSLPVYEDVAQGMERPPDVILLGTNQQGQAFYAMSMTYIILRQHSMGKLTGGFKGVISYVPMVLRNGKGVFIAPGNAWPVDTVGMTTHHTFENIVDVPDITQLSVVDALNQVLLYLAGRSSKLIEQEKFLVGYNILRLLANDIKLKNIILELPEEIDFGCFDVLSDWRRLILVMIFKQDAPGLSDDLEKLFDLDGMLLNGFDFDFYWEEEVLYNALVTIVARQFGDSMSGSYSYYMDLMYFSMDEVEGNKFIPGLEPIILSRRSELESSDELGYLEPLELDEIEHNAGEFFVDTCYPQQDNLNGIRIKGGLQTMVAPSSDFTFQFHRFRIRHTLRLDGTALILESRNLCRVLSEFHDHIRALNLASHLETLITGSQNTITGSLVANIALFGTLGPAPGLWVLSHIIHGNLTVSNESHASYARQISTLNGTLKIFVPLSSGILRSIHAVTDGENVYSIWHPEISLQLFRKAQALHGTRFPSSFNKGEMKSCTILTRRPLI